MRRHAFPFGRFLIKSKSVGEVGPKLKDFVHDFGFPISKYTNKNEGNGTLIIAVNKTIKDFMKQKKPSGHLGMVMKGLSIDMPSFREMDIESQRVGVELYLWPLDEDILLEVFVLPYMSLFDKKEIYGITESKEEEITDWYLCEQIWEDLVPKLEAEFELEAIHKLF